MKNILSNIWNGTASSVAATLTAALTYILAADIEIPDELALTIGALSAALSFIAGPQKQK